VRTLGLAEDWDPSAKADGILGRYQVDKTYEIPGPGRAPGDLFVDAAEGRSDAVRYIFRVLDAASNATTNPASGKFFVSQTGEVSIKVLRAGRYIAQLEAQDRAASTVVVRRWGFGALPEDTKDPLNGPNKQGCGDGVRVDGTPFDDAFTCDCSATRFGGENCDVEVEAGDQGDEAAAVIGAVLAVLIVAVVVVVLVLQWQRHTKSMMATNFFEQLQAMKVRARWTRARWPRAASPASSSARGSPSSTSWATAPLATCGRACSTTATTPTPRSTWLPAKW